MRLIIFTILFFVGSALNAQSYTIIHVMGKIYDTSTNQYLKSGYKLSESSKLKFESPTSRAAVLSSKRGRYIIQKTGNTSNQSDFSYALSSVLSPARGKLSTRAGGINNKMDFINKFGEGTVAWLGDTYEVAVSPVAFPMDESHFFYVKYIYNNEGVNKKLEGENGSIIFDKSTFYSIDNLPIDATQISNAVMYYYDADKEESLEISNVDFALVSKDDIAAIIAGLSDLKADEKNTALHEIILSLYGIPNSADIEKTLEN